MRYKPSDLILPHKGSTRDQDLANNALEKAKNRSEIYILYQRYLLEPQVGNFWKGISEIHHDRYLQHLFFVWILNTINVWGDLDLRSDSEKKSEIEDLKAAIRQVKSIMRTSQKNLFGYDESSPISLRAKGLGLISSEATWSENKRISDDFEKISDEIHKLCESRLLSDGPLNFPARYLPEGPSQRSRESAFRNFFLDELLVGYNSVYGIDPCSKIKNLITELVTIVSGVDTSIDDARKRFERRRDSLFSKLSQTISFTYVFRTKQP